MGLGGALLWTGLAGNLKKRYPQKKTIFIYSKSIQDIIKRKPHPDHIVYKNNKDIFLIFNKMTWSFVKYLFNKNKIIVVDMDNPAYLYWERQTSDKVHYKSGRHAIQIACDVHKIQDAELMPKVFLTKKETAKMDALLRENYLKKNKYICIEPHCKLDWTPNKAWFWERWQELVDELNQFINKNRLDLKIVQIGIGTDNILDNVIDLTGKGTYRETSRIIEKAFLLICYEGGLAHLATAVGKKSIVLISSLLPKELMAYPQNINLYSDISCKACGLKTPCLINRECMEKITVEEVYRIAADYILENKGIINQNKE